MSAALETLAAELAVCRRCPRLVDWREHVAATKRAAFADEEYWGAPVPGFGDPDARVVIVGLAPAAHGANRTGRMFTGDRSGDWLFRALYRTGFANQATSRRKDDGLTLNDVWVTAAVRCAPPNNQPTPSERDSCSQWLDHELALLERTRVYVCLGQVGYVALWQHFARIGRSLPRPRPSFGHRCHITLDDGAIVLTSYHPSQLNTFTGRLTEEMFEGVFDDVRNALRDA